jgi:hypothetical protein
MQLAPSLSPLNRVKELAYESSNQVIVDDHPTVLWTMHTHHHHHDPWMTPSPSCKPPPGIIGESESKRYVPYPWGVNGGLWALQATTSNPTSSTPWTVSKDVHIVDAGTIPKMIVFIQDAEDDVSVLNDDPDHDDDGILPQPTFDVLATLFHDIYKDDSEMEECKDDDDNEDVYDYNQDARAA